jgi:hypothetical protein
MIPVSRLIFGGLPVATGALEGAIRSTNCAISQTLAFDAKQREIGASGIVDAKPDTIVVTEVEFDGVAVQVMNRAMLVDAHHPALEHAVVTFDGIGVDVAVPDVFAAAVGSEFVRGEMLSEVGILPSFVGHDVRAGRDMHLDNGQQVSSGGAAHVEGHDPRTLWAALHEAHDCVLVGIPTTHLGARLPTDEGFVYFDDATFATHRRQAAVLHGFADAMAQEPSGLHAASEGPLKLAGADAFLTAAHHVNGLQPDVQRGMTGLEQRAHADGERLATGVALVKSGAGGLALQLADPIRSLAVVADWTIGPKTGFDVREGGGFVVQMDIGQGGLHGEYLLGRQTSREDWVCQV